MNFHEALHREGFFNKKQIPVAKRYISDQELEQLINDPKYKMMSGGGFVGSLEAQGLAVPDLFKRMAHSGVPLSKMYASYKSQSQTPDEQASNEKFLRTRMPGS